MQTTTNGMLITSVFVLKHHIMTNSVGLADSKVAAEQAVTNTLGKFSCIWTASKHMADSE